MNAWMSSPMHHTQLLIFLRNYGLQLHASLNFNGKNPYEHPLKKYRTHHTMVFRKILGIHWTYIFPIGHS